MESLTKVCTERSAQGCDISIVLTYFVGSGQSYSEHVILETSQELVS